MNTPVSSYDHLVFGCVSWNNCQFSDNALMSNIPRLTIIHGKGNGIKRKAVLQKLKEYKDVKKVWHPEDNEGGIGVTLVEF